MTIGPRLLEAGLHPENIHDSDTMPALALENFNFVEYAIEVMGEANSGLFNMLVNERIITESVVEKILKSFNLEGVLKSIIKWFCTVIGKIVDQFAKVMVDIMAMGKGSFAAMLKAKEKDLKNLKKDVAIKFPTYNFTCINDSPPANLREEFAKYPTLLFDNMPNRASAAELIRNMNELATIYDEDIEVAAFKCELLNRKWTRGTEMTDDEFRKECFKFFRGGANEPIKSSVIPGSMVWDILQDYKRCSDDVKRIKNENKQMQKSSEAATSRMRGIKLPITAIDPKYDEVAGLVSSVASMFCKIIRHNAQDIAIMYTEKLQAYKDYQVQCKKILVAALEVNAANSEDKVDELFDR